MKASDLFRFPESLAAFAAHFPGEVAPWEWLRAIGPALESFPFGGPPPAVPAGVRIEGPVHLDPSVKLPPFAVIVGPAWIGPGVRIGPGAVVRGPLIVGAGSVLGHACEYKHCLLLERVETAHFNYVGDSVLGNGSHLGAGAICSNLRLDRRPVAVRGPDGALETGLRKLGALVGDGAEVGCNAVLNPGAVLGPRSLVAPALAFGGYLPPATIAKARQAVSLVPRGD
jgi:bifunctional UDP-N-acetylglucosamine pyrophosphorylase / glucosamine-1-phosphate N-acetyltransferase